MAFVRVSHGTFAGASKMLLRLMTSLDDSVFVPKLISQYDDELCKRAKDRGIEVDVVPYRGALDSYNGTLFQLRNFFPASIRALQYNYEIAKHLKDIDILWCQNSRVVLTLAPHILRSHQPTIWNIGLGLESKRAMSYIHSICFSLVDRVFIESESQAKSIFSKDKYKNNRKRFKIFHKGIDLEKFDPNNTEPLINQDDFLIGTAASITPRKGIEYLITAVGQLSEEYQVNLVIAGEVGSPEYKRDLEKLINEYGLNRKVKFLGWIEDMPSYICSLDLFVLPSLNEGIPGAVREALAMEVPVIATDVGGTSDVVIDRQTGYLIPPKNTNVLKKYIEKMISNPDSREIFGENGRKLIENEFSVAQYTNDYEQFLHEMYQDKY